MRGSGRRSGRASVLCLAALVAALPVFATGPEEGSPAGPARFAERSSELGIDFRHRNYGTGEKYMPENMGAGA